MAAQTNQRSLRLLKGRGYIAAVVERWNDAVGIRQDLFGFLDIIAFFPDRPGVLGVQATTAGGRKNHLATLRRHKLARAWRRVKGRELELHVWHKQKLKRGGTAFRWVCDRIVL